MVKSKTGWEDVVTVAVSVCSASSLFYFGPRSRVSTGLGMFWHSDVQNRLLLMYREHFGGDLKHKAGEAALVTTRAFDWRIRARVIDAATYP